MDPVLQGRVIRRASATGAVVQILTDLLVDPALAASVTRREAHRLLFLPWIRERMVIPCALEERYTQADQWASFRDNMARMGVGELLPGILRQGIM